MGATDKAKNITEDLGGKAKEAAGKMTDNERLEAEGEAQKMKGKTQSAG